MIELMFLPLVAGLMIAVAVGPLGSMVVWNRMAYFGDTLAHASLLGISLAFLFQLNTDLGILLTCFAVAGALLFFRKNNFLPKDTLLGIFAHGSLAAGIVLASFSKDMRIDLMAFLFGDILAVNEADVLACLVISVLAVSLLYFHWRKLLICSIDAELAQVEGINPRSYQALLLFLLAGVIALSIKIIGVLLIAALLILPAASARIRASSPATMAVMASLYAISAVIAGLLLSWFFDTPAGPSIVLLSFALFLLTSITSSLFLKTA